jgi:hypothetical protein
VTEPAGQVSDRCRCQTHKPFGDAGGIHQVGGQQKERYSQQNEAVVRLPHFVDQQHGRQAFIDKHDRDAGQSQGK